MKIRNARSGKSGSRQAGWTVARLLRLFEARRAELNPLDGSDRPDDSFERGWRGVVRTRVLVALALMAGWGVSLQGRLVYLQVVRHEEFAAKAIQQQQDLVTSEALRGSIHDRHQRLLAYSVDAQSIGVRPRLVKDRPKLVATLCAALADCTPKERRELLAAVSQDKPFVYLRRARTLSPEQVTRVEALKLREIAIEADTRRYYPAGDLAAHALGFVSVDNSGQGGLEHVYNDRLRGVPGREYVQVDALGNPLDRRVERAPVPGATVETTIDVVYQHIVERELRAGVEANGAKGGTAVLMHPFTGEVLAIASYPTFNPNNAWESTADARRNRATQDVYEPGSTFKIFSASAAIQENVVRPTDMIDTGGGSIRIVGRPRAITDTHAYGVISFADVVAKSSNVGTVKVVQRLGAERFAKYVHLFGFGEALAPDVIGESRGIWSDANLTETALASAAIGYQVSVTPLQMATAVSAVANGGLLMEPHLVRAVVRDGHRDEVQPKVLRRAIEPATAATMTAMLEGVTEDGTATSAQLSGYRVAGKTGTARKVENGRYSSDYNASFVGFVPSRAPEFTLLVVIDSPRKGTYYGGTVAAPIFKRIAEAVLQRAGVPPSVNPAPPVVLRAGASTLPPARVIDTELPFLVPAGGPALMPDLIGLSAREATRALVGVGLSLSVSGEGFVARQSPEAGVPVESGDRATLRLERGGPASARFEGRP